MSRTQPDSGGAATSAGWVRHGVVRSYDILFLEKLDGKDAKGEIGVTSSKSSSDVPAASTPLYSTKLMV